MRDKNLTVARDNVIFEAGLFMGELGRDRVFIVKPRDVPDFHTISDLAGFTTLTYESKRAKRPDEANSALATAANKIENDIKGSAWATLNLSIKTKLIDYPAPSTTYKMKVDFAIKNNNSFPIILQSTAFNLNSKLRLPKHIDEIHRKPSFLRIKKDHSHEYHHQITIEPNQQILSCWIPVDPTLDKSLLNKHIDDKEIGTWKYRCVLLKDHVIVCDYEKDF